MAEDSDPDSQLELTLGFVELGNAARRLLRLVGDGPCDEIGRVN